MYSNFTLLDGGKNAFDEIIKCIDRAKFTVKINMFIWRADEIGLKLAKSVLSAANRGVKIDISVDRYGYVLELCEESMHSFFHTDPTIIEKIKVCFLKLFYKTKKVKFVDIVECDIIKKELLNHPNVTIDKDRFKADHSKYYVIDDNILFLGGINVEDKEITKDYLGRIYQDYMVKIVDNRAIDGFFAKMRAEKSLDSSLFIINKKGEKRLFEMKDAYLNIINDSSEFLYITMAYFSPDKCILNAIKNAQKRGVKVVITIPNSANFQDDLNKKTVKKLLKTNPKNVRVYLSPKMVHTKLIASEKQITVGSTNVGKKAFNQLDELNLLIENKECSFSEELFNSIDENRKISKAVELNDIKYCKIKAFLEGILM